VRYVTARGFIGSVPVEARGLVVEQTTTSSYKPLHKFLLVLFCGLIIVNLISLVYILPIYLSKKPDLYRNQHARLLLGSIGQIFLCSGMVWSTAAQLKTSDPALRTFTPSSIVIALSIGTDDFKLRLLAPLSL
jgi:hypothetical protein